jgi:hypothetical protein
MTTEAKEHHATQQKSRAPRRSRRYARPATESLQSSAKKEGPKHKELVIHEWSDIPGPLHEAVIASLKEVCHDLDTLARSGYKVREITQEDLGGYAKCMNCQGAYCIRY